MKELLNQTGSIAATTTPQIPPTIPTQQNATNNHTSVRAPVAYVQVARVMTVIATVKTAE